MAEYQYPAGYNFIQSIGRTYKQVKDPIGTMQESMARYNGTYTVHLGMKQYIVTQDPAFIEYVLKNNHRNYHKSELQTKQLGRFLGKGLLTSNGEFWLRQRRLIQPGFHADKIQALYTIMKKTSEDFVGQFPTGENIDLYPLMNRLAFDIVINTLFNVRIEESMRNELSAFIYETQEFVIKDIRNPHKSWWYTLSGELRATFAGAARAREIIRSLIARRTSSGENHHDLLDMLLEARYEDNGEPMKEDQMIDEILVLIIAGHETTANALTWTLYLLATHPEYQESLRSETKVGDLHTLVSNELLNAVIRESMRLYPPAWVSDRVSLNEDQFSAYHFPGNTVIILFYFGLHRDPKFWDDPSGFHPERFMKSHPAYRENGKIYFPFGSGPRLCIGNNFAMAEMALFLQTFIQKLEVSPSGTQPRINALVTLKPENVLLHVRRILK